MVRTVRAGPARDAVVLIVEAQLVELDGIHGIDVRAAVDGQLPILVRLAYKALSYSVTEEIHSPTSVL